MFLLSLIHTPTYGYIFHSHNVWPSRRADAGHILDNVRRMVEHEHRVADIRFNAPVDTVARTSSRGWRINGQATEYEGLLVATGYMGWQDEAPAAMQSAFSGRTC